MSTESDLERADLVRADQHIADAERHVAGQELRIERLRADGHDVTAFEDALATFKDVLSAHRTHRSLILQRIEHLEKVAASRKTPG